MSDSPQLPIVSVILPIHNRAASLSRAMESVLNQGYTDLELIIVDDGSTDDCRSVVARNDDPRIRLLRHESNRGAAAARNTGIRAAKGDWIAFQDSDDVWAADKLEKQLQLALSDKQSAHVIYCGMQRAGQGADGYVPRRTLEQREGDVLRTLLAGNFVGTPSLLVRRDTLERVGLFDERLPRFQDWELAIRLAQVAEFRLADEPLVFVHEAAGNISSSGPAFLEALEILLKKHEETFQIDRASYSRHLMNLGARTFFAGRLGSGCRHLLLALRMHPLTLRNWITTSAILVRSPARAIAKRLGLLGLPRS